MKTRRPVRNYLKKYGKSYILSGFLALLTTQTHAQQAEPFHNSFDTLPTLAKTYATAQEGYIVITDNAGPFKVGLIKADFQSQMRNDSGDIPFQYWVTPAPNAVDLEYSIDTEIKQEGTGSLNVKFKRGDLRYWGGTEVNIFFPPIDARGADIRFWLRSENDTGKSVYVYLLDEMFRPCEYWAFYKPAVGQWRHLEIAQGKQSGATRHMPSLDNPAAKQETSCTGDIKRVSGIQITMNGYDEQVAADYRLDGLEVTPAPRTYFSTVLSITGECSLRSEAGVDGISARWFDPQIDDTDWKKTIIPNRWDEANNPVAWYRIQFTLSEDAIAVIADKPAYMLFKGVDESAWIWLNGVKLGSHSEDRMEGWDQPFAFDVTEHLKTEGENLLVVKVLNREQAGGIWRPISIVTEQSR